MKSTRFFALTTAAVLCVATLSGCGPSPQIAALREGAVVVAFGDSLTQGMGAEPSQSYPAVLARLTGLRVVNAGVSGEFSAEGLERLPGVLAAYRPALVVLCHGGNDMLQRRSSSVTEENVSAMVRMIREAGSDVILVGVPQPSLGLKTAALYKNVASAYHIPCEADAVRDILLTPTLRSDHVHMNADGYARLARAVADIIRQSAADP
jgi:lysophospholipase L1-like esterase